MSEFEWNRYYRLVPEDIQPVEVAPEALLWDEAFRASKISCDVQTHLESLYEEIHAKRASKSFTDHQDADELEANYWEQQARLQELRDVETDLLKVLEQFEAGELTRDDLRVYLPTNTEEETKSKRRLAIERARVQNTASSLTSLELFMYGYGYSLEGPSPTTDPRRLATGRNLSKLVARERLGSFSAEHKFFEVTADTHGGKSRRPGKDANYYVSASGRRIRKR